MIAADQDGILVLSGSPEIAYSSEALAAVDALVPDPLPGIDLRVHLADPDVLLRWTGGPADYSVLFSSGPTFEPGSTYTLPADCSSHYTRFTHTGAAIDGNAWYYLVDQLP